MGALQCITVISDSQGVPTFALPLAFVLITTGVKDIFEDIKRHKSDAIENNRVTERIAADGSISEVQWRDLVIGDIVRIKNNSPLPADLIILSCSGEFGVVYVETKSLDGETNLKQKNVLPEIAALTKTPHNAANVPLKLVYEPPSERLYDFDGRIQVLDEKEASEIQKAEAPKFSHDTEQNSFVLDRNLAESSAYKACIGKKFALSPDQFLLRGSNMVNTEWCIGIVVYAGHQTRIFRNSNTKNHVKWTQLGKAYNRHTFVLFALQIFFCAFIATGSVIFTAMEGAGLWYVQEKDIDYKDSSDHARLWFIVFGRQLILYSYYIPISLHVQMEFTRAAQALFVIWDKSMYDKETDIYASVQTTGIMEELGAITHVFSDKTGTLTQNVMQLRAICIGRSTIGDADVAQASRNPQALLNQIKEQENANNDALRFDPTQARFGAVGRDENSDCCDDFDNNAHHMKNQRANLSSTPPIRVGQPGDRSSHPHAELLPEDVTKYTHLPSDGLENIHEAAEMHSDITEMDKQRAMMMCLSLCHSVLIKTHLVPKIKERASMTVNSDANEIKKQQSDSNFVSQKNKIKETKSEGKKCNGGDSLDADLKMISTHEVQDIASFRAAIQSTHAPAPSKTVRQLRRITRDIQNRNESHHHRKDNDTKNSNSAPKKSRSLKKLSSTKELAALGIDDISVGIKEDDYELSSSYEEDDDAVFGIATGIYDEGDEDDEDSVEEEEEDTSKLDQTTIPTIKIHTTPSDAIHSSPCAVEAVKPGLSFVRAPDVAVGGYDAQSPDELALVCGASWLGALFFSRPSLRSIQVAMTNSAVAKLLKYWDDEDSLTPAIYNTKNDIENESENEDRFNTDKEDLTPNIEQPQVSSNTNFRPSNNKLQVKNNNSSYNGVPRHSSSNIFIPSITSRDDLSSTFPVLSYELLEVLDFDNDRKRMSTIVKDGCGTVWLLTKGADSTMIQAAAKGQNETLHSIKAQVAAMARKGLRTLVLGWRILEDDELQEFQKSFSEAKGLTGLAKQSKVKIAIEKMEKNLWLAGCSGIEDKLQDDVPVTISELHQGGVKLWVLTGDKMETAISIGHSCNLLTDATFNAIIDGSTPDSVKAQVEKFNAYCLAAELINKELDASEFLESGADNFSESHASEVDPNQIPSHVRQGTSILKPIPATDQKSALTGVPTTLQDQNGSDFLQTHGAATAAGIIHTSATNNNFADVTEAKHSVSSTDNLSNNQIFHSSSLPNNSTLPQTPTVPPGPAEIPLHKVMRVLARVSPDEALAAAAGESHYHLENSTMKRDSIVSIPILSGHKSTSTTLINKTGGVDSHVTQQPKLDYSNQIPPRLSSSSVVAPSAVDLKRRGSAVPHQPDIDCAIETASTQQKNHLHLAPAPNNGGADLVSKLMALFSSNEKANAAVNDYDDDDYASDDNEEDLFENSDENGSDDDLVHKSSFHAYGGSPSSKKKFTVSKHAAKIDDIDEENEDIIANVFSAVEDIGEDNVFMSSASAQSSPRHNGSQRRFDSNSQNQRQQQHNLNLNTGSNRIQIPSNLTATRHSSNEGNSARHPNNNAMTTPARASAQIVHDTPSGDITRRTNPSHRSVHSSAHPFFKHVSSPHDGGSAAKHVRQGTIGPTHRAPVAHTQGATTVKGYSALAVTVSGDALNLILRRRQLRVEFFKLTRHCSTVIACRVTPKQKAELVKQCCAFLPATVALAIGDGANDVSMILAAHVGVGIAGKEGLQAVRSADFAIGQFSFLKRLLLVHGKEALRRNALQVYFTIFKNIAFCMVNFFLAWSVAWSGFDFYDPYLKQLFNTPCTCFPIMFFGVFDREIPLQYMEKCAFLFPAFKGKGSLDNVFGPKVFWRWYLYSIYVAVITSLIPLYSLGSPSATSSVVEGMQALSLWEVGCAQFVSAVFSFNIILIPFHSEWFWFSHVVLWVSSFLVFACWWVVGALGLSTNLVTALSSSTLPSGLFWATCCVCIVLNVFPVFVWKWGSLIDNPQPATLIKERIKKGVHDVVIGPRKNGRFAVLAPRDPEAGSKTANGFAFSYPEASSEHPNAKKRKQQQENKLSSNVLHGMKKLLRRVNSSNIINKNVDVQINTNEKSIPIDPTSMKSLNNVHEHNSQSLSPSVPIIADKIIEAAVIGDKMDDNNTKM